MFTFPSPSSTKTAASKWGTHLGKSGKKKIVNCGEEYQIIRRGYSNLTTSVGGPYVKMPLIKNGKGSGRYHISHLVCRICLY